MEFCITLYNTFLFFRPMPTLPVDLMHHLNGGVSFSSNTENAKKEEQPMLSVLVKPKGKKPPRLSIRPLRISSAHLQAINKGKKDTKSRNVLDKQTIQQKRRPP
jgi:hypothetical protein